MEASIYTIGVWRVKTGKEGEFVEAWKGLSNFFAALPQPPGGKGTLVQSLKDPQLFYSFGPWDSMEAIDAMRANPEAQKAIQLVAELCTEAVPGTFRVVAQG